MEILRLSSRPDFLAYNAILIDEALFCRPKVIWYLVFGMGDLSITKVRRSSTLSADIKHHFISYLHFQRTLKLAPSRFCLYLADLRR
jgi:hypothetical protein